MKHISNNILILICATGFLAPSSMFVRILVAIGLVYSIIELIIKALRAQNVPLFIIFLFFSFYCFTPVLYLLGNQDYIIENIREAENESTVMMASVCLLTFITVFGRFIKIKFPPDIKSSKEQLLNIKSKPAFIVTIILSLLCMFLGISGANLYEAGGYGDDIGSRSSAFEYGVIFLSLALVFSSDKGDRTLLYVICLTYILRDLLFGGRVSSFMLVLSIFILRFRNKFSFKQILVFLVIGYIFFQFWGVYRSSLNQADFDISQKDGNASFVFYAAMRIHYLMDIGLLPIEMRVLSLVYFIASIFVPSSYLPPIASLPSYLKDEFYTGGGGLVSTYFYCWLWIPGVIFIAYFVAKQLNQLYNKQSPYRSFYALLILISAPRWFAYYPIQIFKFALYGMIAFWMLSFLFGGVKKKRIASKKDTIT